MFNSQIPNSLFLARWKLRPIFIGLIMPWPEANCSSIQTHKKKRTYSLEPTTVLNECMNRRLYWLVQSFEVDNNVNDFFVWHILANAHT